MLLDISPVISSKRISIFSWNTFQKLDQKIDYMGRDFGKQLRDYFSIES